MVLLLVSFPICCIVEIVRLVLKLFRPAGWDKSVVFDQPDEDLEDDFEEDSDEYQDYESQDDSFDYISEGDDFK